MSTTPPSTPPGGPIPPYDPKTQWRVYREQQKAAWRAQRDAWKAHVTPGRPAVSAPTGLVFHRSSAPLFSSPSA